MIINILFKVFISFCLGYTFALLEDPIKNKKTLILLTRIILISLLIIVIVYLWLKKGWNELVEETTLNRKHYRYFIYSETQYKERVEIEKRIGRVYKPGIVVYKGRKKQYTEVVSNIENLRYADYKIVAEGYIEDMTFTRSSHNWGW